MGVSKTSDHIQINIWIPNPNQEPPASSKALNEDLKGHGCSLHLQNEDREPICRIWVYQRPVTSSRSWLRCQTPGSNLQHPPMSKSGPKGPRCSLHFQSQESNPKFEKYVYQRPVTISKPRWRCQTPARNLQLPPKLKLGLKGDGCSLNHQNQFRQIKFKILVYQRSVTISKLRLRCQTLVRNLQCPPKPQTRT